MIEKGSDEEEEVIITTKDTSQKKRHVIRKEAVYPTSEFFGLMQTPPAKKFRPVNLGNTLESIKKAPKNSLISSLPVCLREASYFDGQDQCRTLLGEKKGGTYEKTNQNKLKDIDDPSFGECDVNIETDYDFE